MECSSQVYMDKSLDTLNDLASLVGTSALPIVNQIGFYLSESKKLCEKKDNDQNSKIDGIVFDFISCAFKELTSCFLASSKSVKEIKISGKGEFYSFKEWNKIFETLPGLLKVINFFEIDGVLELILEKNGIRAIVHVEENQDLTLHRKKCYSILRDLIKKKTLLTFKITPEEKNKLDLFLNISHTEDVVYECMINHESQISLGFSNIFEQYQIGEHIASSLPKHLCLEITQNLQLLKHHGIPNHFTQELGDFQIIHFSFLFRLVSIIIPFRGKLSPITSRQGLGDTGRGDTLGLTRNYGDLGMRRCSYVDLFDIISN